MTGKHGNHSRGRKVEYIPVTCEVCAKVREYSPSEVRVRGVIRFCSKPCEIESRRRETTKIEVSCTQCGVVFRKRHDHLHENNYCSKECTSKARRIDGAKWRDPGQIRIYMREYVSLNRESHNRRSTEWSKANREKRNANQRLRRSQGHGRGFIGRVRRELIKRYGEVCLRCGGTDHIQVDHVIPVALGGPNVMENMQLLCRTCNIQKSATIADYRIDIQEV